jgi:predicted lysophospholipase L1 biosynthesis ABC-type transport system permease subunit
MARTVIRRRIESIWQKLAISVVVLAAVMFVGHAVAAQGTFSHAHNHGVEQAGASHLAADAHGGDEQTHKAPSATDHQHSKAERAKQMCCGEACLLALMPADEPHLAKPWDVPSKALMAVSFLTGQDPEGLRRPPRLSHRI